MPATFCFAPTCLSLLVWKWHRPRSSQVKVKILSEGYKIWKNIPPFFLKLHSKVQILWEGHKIWKKYPTFFWNYLVMSIFFLWPSQNIWTLEINLGKLVPCSAINVVIILNFLNESISKLQNKFHQIWNCFVQKYFVKHYFLNLGRIWPSLKKILKLLNRCFQYFCCKFSLLSGPFSELHVLRVELYSALSQGPLKK